ncbi:T9SS type A sorting domain-containing protein [Candidatus Nomurabacteria bacterium]|nr:T9SS type A sorting domain-containing protein [Candidatus Nomurabacteria bacterium]
MKSLFLILSLLVASTNSFSQNLNLNLIAIDTIQSLSTPDSVKVKVHIKGLTATGFYRINFGLSPNYNLNSTVSTFMSPVSDTVIYVRIGGLAPSSTYLFQAQLLPGGASGASAVDTFVTSSCSFSPLISALNTTCVGDTVILIAQPFGASYQWKRNGTLIAGTDSVLHVCTTGTYNVVVTRGACTATSGNFTFTVYNPPLASISGTLFLGCVGGSTTLTAGSASSYLWTGGSTSQSLVVSTAGTYQIKVSNTCGSDSANVVVTMGTPPSLSVSSSSSICLGAPVVLTVSGASSYLWTPLNSTSATNTISPVTTTTYTVIGVTGGCSDTASVTVIVNPLPIVNVNGAIPICIGSSLVLTATGANTYQWSNGVTTNTLSVAPTANTTYTVTGTDVNGCNSGAFGVVIVNLNNTTVTLTSQDTACINGVTNIPLSGLPLNVNGTYSGIGVTGNLFIPANAGTGAHVVSYSVTDNSGCTASASKTIWVIDAPVVDSVDLLLGVLTVYGHFPYSVEMLIGSSVYNPSVQNSSKAVFALDSVIYGQTIIIRSKIGGCFSTFIYQGYATQNSSLVDNEQIRVFPNPFNNNFQIDVPFGIYDLNIINSQGQTIFAGSFENSFVFDGMDIPAGVYHIGITGQDGLRFSQTVVRQ